jgi:hypothetical protein
VLFGEAISTTFRLRRCELTPSPASPKSTSESLLDRDLYVDLGEVPLEGRWGCFQLLFQAFNVSHCFLSAMAMSPALNLPRARRREEQSDEAIATLALEQIAPLRSQ